MLRIHAAVVLLTFLPAPCLAETTPGSPPNDGSNIHLTPGPVATKEMFDRIASQDAALFEAVFTTCDVERFGQLITDDFEFYHDKGGLTSTSRAQSVADMRKQCERLQRGTDFRARREVVPGTMAVYPLNNYGAVQTGMHRFYALIDGKPDRLTETARFLHVWKLENDDWKLARVVSYDHQLAE